MKPPRLRSVVLLLRRSPASPAWPVPRCPARTTRSPTFPASASATTPASTPARRSCAPPAPRARAWPVASLNAVARGSRARPTSRPDNMVEIMNAIVLSGGSAYGIAATSGVMSCLENAGIGFPVGTINGVPAVVPIAPTATSFDRATCNAPPASRPDFTSGVQACVAATSGPVAEGNVGAGTGAVSGGVKGGIGTASVVLPNGIIVGAIVVGELRWPPYDDQRRPVRGLVRQLGNEFTALHPSIGAPPESRAPPTCRRRAAQRHERRGRDQRHAHQGRRRPDRRDGRRRPGPRASARRTRPGDSDTLFVLGTARLRDRRARRRQRRPVTQIGAAAGRRGRARDRARAAGGEDDRLPPELLRQLPRPRAGAGRRATDHAIPATFGALLALAVAARGLGPDAAAEPARMNRSPTCPASRSASYTATNGDRRHDRHHRDARAQRRHRRRERSAAARLARASPTC